MKKQIKEIFRRDSSIPLIVFELANNHMGDINHGLKIIQELSNIAQQYNFLFAFKLQFRDLDTFIHPDYKKTKDIKSIKRFSETRLTVDNYKKLQNKIQKLNHLAICTPFDEPSVDLLEKMDFDILKLASCSFTDWSLLEKIALTEKPIIASTAGASLKDIDRVVSFFQHRKKYLALMHCVGAYPTKNENLELNQIDLLKERYPDLPIGYSTHEEPDNFTAGILALAKGAKIFEKHVGIKNEKYELNAYSATPYQIKKWLDSLKFANGMLGVSGKRMSFTKKETEDLTQFKRGMYAKNNIKKGEKITTNNIFFAIPNWSEQILANDFSKYSDITAVRDIIKNQPITTKSIKKIDNRKEVNSAVEEVKRMLKDSNIILPAKLDFELSHHYGMSSFRQYGATLINIINRDYCKKIVVMFPKQEHPSHYHKKKEETFHVLYGDFVFTLNGIKRIVKAGDVLTIEPGIKHGFMSKKGGILEEISTTHFISDSFYIDNKINKNAYRKTKLTYWIE